MSDDIVKVYVGSDPSQELAVDVLRHSIQRHTDLKVEVISMTPFPVKDPEDPRQRKRTGFSFSRFNIPKLNGYKGRAIYMDADMIVFKDIAELWNMPFDGKKLLIQNDLSDNEAATNQKEGAPTKRIKQTAVMVLDCEALKWDVEEIVAGLDRWDYSYEQLMYELCILEEDEVGYKLPFEWNSLEHWNENTRLLHFTDVRTQPWTSPNNDNGWLWFKEVQMMLENGSLKWEQVQAEIDKEYFRPSLMNELKRKQPPNFLMKHIYRMQDRKLDESKKYIMHKEVYKNKKIRKQAIKEFEEKLKAQGQDVSPQPQQ